MDKATDKGTIFSQRCIALSNQTTFLFLSGKINNIVIVQVYLMLIYLAVGSLYKAQLIDSGIHTKRRNKSDVRAFRRLDRAQTTVVSVVNVTNLKARTLTRQTSGAKGRKTTLVGHLGQRVGLIHELAQRVGAKERVDNTRYGLGIDQIGRCEHLIIANIHAFTNGTAHAGQTDRELVGQLLTNSTYTTIGQMVNVINHRVGVNQLNEIFNDLDNVFLGQHTHIHVDVLTKFLIDAIATHLTQIISLVREEQVLEHLPCTRVIGRLRITQLTIYIVHSLSFRVAGIFLQCLEDNIILIGRLSVLMNKNSANATLEYGV